jgi:hypothetical protein
MTCCVGIDEAGYGPNLGPLMIAATVWRAPAARRTDPFALLAESLGAAAGRTAGGRPLVMIEDSKVVYGAGRGLEVLEQSVLAALGNTGRYGSADLPAKWQALWQRLAPSARRDLKKIPWYRHFDAEVPRAALRSDVDAARGLLKECLRQARITLFDCQARAIFAQTFNRQVARCGSKGQALSQWTVRLMRLATERLPDERILVFCDKHGGRNQYAGLLKAEFPGTLIQVVRESRQESVYRWQADNHHLEARFVANGERYLPTALSSMVAKMLRESAMQAFNAFWCQRLPDLKPTAGYPRDAQRFRDQIRHIQQQEAIPDDWLWRCR